MGNTARCLAPIGSGADPDPTARFSSASIPVQGGNGVNYYQYKNLEVDKLLQTAQASFNEAKLNGESFIFVYKASYVMNWYFSRSISNRRLKVRKQSSPGFTRTRTRRGAFPEGRPRVAPALPARDLAREVMLYKHTFIASRRHGAAHPPQPCCVVRSPFATRFHHVRQHD